MIVRLPAKHARDWQDRLGGDLGSTVVAESARTITLDLPPAALADFIEDAALYATEMHGEWTAGVDYRPAARRCLAAIAKAMP